MAKAKSPATDDVVDTAQDNDFSEPEREPPPLTRVVERSGNESITVADQIQAIREVRASQRKARGQAGKKRVITHYHDAERLFRLNLLSPEEVVDAEEAGLLPDPARDYYDAAASSGIPTDVEGV